MTTTTGAKPHPIFLAGRWVESPDPLVIENPARPGEQAGATFHATPEQYEEAVDAAVAAFETTRNLPAYERGAILRNVSNGIKARREELGRLIALEAGKPIRDALTEVDRAVAHVPPGRRGGGADARRGHPARPHAGAAAAGSASPAASRSGPIAGISPVQLPAQPGRPQGVAGDRVGQPDRAQAAVQGPARDADGGRDHRGGRRARRERSACCR